MVDRSVIVLKIMKDTLNDNDIKFTEDTLLSEFKNHFLKIESITDKKVINFFKEKF
jgi:hypothetical protein